MSEPAAPRPAPPVVRYRSRWSVIHAGALVATWAVCSLIVFLVVPQRFAKAVVVAVAIVILVAVIRRVTASLTMTPQGLVVRSVAATHRLPWAEVDAIDVGSKRIVGSGSKAYFLRYQTRGRKVAVRSTLVGWGERGRAEIVMLLDAAEHHSAGSNVSVSRSDPWNAGTTFPRTPLT